MIWMDVDTALASVPVNAMPLISSADFVTIMDAVVYNQAGLALFWNFTTTAGVTTVTAITPTTSGTYDWTDFTTSGMYGIEIPASGGASINNDTEGFGHFTGVATGILPWAGPIIGFRAAALNNSLVDAGTTGLLAPTTAARTLNVSAAGEADADVKLWNGSAVATPTVAGVPEVDVTHWIGTAVATPTVAGVPEVDITHINGGATSGNNATLSLKALDINNNAGDAITAISSGGDGHGLLLLANGTGDGLRTEGGATGRGLDVRGGATSGEAVLFLAQAGNSDAVLAQGFGTGAGGNFLGGASGIGVGAVGGATAGEGLRVQAQAAATDGFLAIGGAGGFDINAPNSDIGGIHVVEMTAAALADFFTVDSGETYASAVAGSVVKEIADNASANPATIATAVWAEAVPGAFVAGSAGFILGTNLNAQITSRMATYTQPTGFLAATFPAGTVASTTNLTAGTIATVTNDVGITQAGADKVWLTAARTLTSGANIVLAKGVGVTGFNDLSAAQVNAEMVDVIAVDTYAEPAGAPAATATLAVKIGRLHQVLRNKLTVTATTLTLFDDAGAALWTKPLADNGVTYTESEGS